MKKKFNCLTVKLLFFAFLVASGLKTSNVYGQVAPDANLKLTEYLNAHLAQGTFSGTVLVTQKSKPVYSQGFGMADYETNLANGPEVKYRIGSVTKSFTAVLVMQLQEQGKLEVQDKINKYLPDFPNGDKITIQQLLSNTSGLPDFVNHWQKVNTKPATAKDILALVQDKPLEFEPGTKWKYSSTGFVVLGQIIEKVTGKTYEEVLKKQVLKPLKMKDSGLEGSDPVPSLAKGYNHDAADRKPAKPIDMSWCNAAGAMYSTAADLAKFDEALRGTKLLSEASKKAMFTPGKKDYGYGWVIDSVGGKLRINNSGAINGFKASFVRFPDQEIAIMILSNYESQQVNGPISKDITAIVLGGKYQVPAVHKPVQLSAAQLNAYIGEYQLGPNMKCRIYLEDNQLFAEAPGQGTFHIFPEAEDKFFIKVAPAQITFEKDAEGNVTKMVMHHNGRAMPADRIN